MLNTLINLENGKLSNVKNLKMKIVNINLEDDDIIELTVDIDSKSLYIISIIKGEYFPTPKENDFFEPNEFYLEYDEYLFLRLYAKGIIKKNDNKIFQKYENINPIKLIGNELLNNLTSIFSIKDKLKSDIFLVEDINEKYYYLYLFKESKKYKIKKNEINLMLNKGNYVLIDNYNEIKENIIFNKLTQLKKLNEELLIRFSLKIYNDCTQIIIIKIISIEDDCYIVLDNKRNVFKILINDNLKKRNIKLCQILIIKNFKIINDQQSNIKLLELIEDSIIYISSQDIYFSNKKITLNFYSAIKLIFLDFTNNNNLYNIIEISNKQYNIIKKEMYIIFPSFKLNNVDQFAITIELLNDKGIKRKIYYFILYHGLLNKINVFINYSSDDTFFIEYFYYHINRKINNIKKDIEINGDIYKLNDFDTFQTENRQRINILNVPLTSIQNEHFNQSFFSSLKKSQRSFQICELFSDKSNLLFGIFDIQEIFDKFVILNENSDFDNYYDSYGNVENEIDDLKSFITKYTEMFKELKEKNPCLYKNIETLCNYESQITYSQYKTRLGLIICKNIIEANNFPIAKHLITRFKMIRIMIEEKNLTYYQKLRIYQFYFSRKFNNIDIVFFDDLDKINSPYILANNFNKEEIKNINIYSRFFSAYLQFDSFILYNYIYKENSFSFSLELDFVLKHNLLSNYEEFIFTSSEEPDDIFDYEALNGNITVINEKNLLGKSDVQFINEIKESKNIAFLISMENRHEKNCRTNIRKKNLGNTPILFCKDCKIKRIVSDKNPKKRENGRIIESFIYDSQLKINKLKTLNKYGCLLDYRYFTDKNFDKLKKKVVEIDNETTSIENKKGKEIKEGIKDENEDEDEDEDEINEENEEEDKLKKEKNKKGKENNSCEIFDKNKIKFDDSKNDLNSNTKESKEIEVGKTYFIGDVEYIQLDKDNSGKHMNEIKSLPKYFLKMQKIEDGDNK